MLFTYILILYINFTPTGAEKVQLQMFYNKEQCEMVAKHIIDSLKPTKAYECLPLR